MLQVKCLKAFNNPSTECRMDCPGRHFDVKVQSALFLDGMVMAGSKVGSVVVEQGGMMIGVESRWES